MLSIRNSFTFKKGFYASWGCGMQKELREILNFYKIPLDKDADFHVTCVYSPICIPKTLDIPIYLNKYAYADLCSPCLFGDNKDILIIKLNCPLFHKLHDYFIDQGAQHSYPSFKPHITLKYNTTLTPALEADCKNAISYFKESYPKLMFDSFNFEDI